VVPFFFLLLSLLFSPRQSLLFFYGLT
jgi:hypothetical protein